MQGYAGGSLNPGSSNLFDLRVQCITGEGLLLKVSPAMLGREVRQMVSKKFASKRGAKLVLHHGTSALLLSQTLQEQGIVSDATTISCTYTPANLFDAWCFIQELATPEEEFALEGLAHLTVKMPGQSLNHLPKSLEHLTVDFNPIQGLRDMHLPNGLRTLTFGDNFNQNLQPVTLPPSLQSLTFGEKFDQSLELVTLPPSLQTLTFGRDFNQNLERVTLPPNLQMLTFGHCFNQSLEQATLPPSLQTLTFGSLGHLGWKPRAGAHDFAPILGFAIVLVSSSIKPFHPPVFVCAGSRKSSLVRCLYAFRLRRLAQSERPVLLGLYIYIYS